MVDLYKVVRDYFINDYELYQAVKKDPELRSDAESDFSRLMSDPTKRELHLKFEIPNFNILFDLVYFRPKICSANLFRTAENFTQEIHTSTADVRLRRHSAT